MAVLGFLGSPAGGDACHVRPAGAPARRHGLEAVRAGQPFHHFPSRRNRTFRADLSLLLHPIRAHHHLFSIARRPIIQGAPFPYRSRLCRGFAGYGGHCHESGVAWAEILAPPFDVERRVLLRRIPSAHAGSSRRRFPALVAGLAHFHRRGGAGADVPFAELPHDRARTDAQQGHRHGDERYGAAA